MRGKKIFLLRWRGRRRDHTAIKPEVSAVLPGGLGGQALDPFPVQLGRTAAVLGVGVIRVTPVLMEKGRCISISSNLHASQLKPRPVRIQLCRSDETQVDAQGPVAPRAVDAQEYPVGDAGPAGVLGTTVKTHLVGGHRAEALEDGQDVLLAGVPHDHPRMGAQLAPPTGKGRAAAVAASRG